MTDKRTEWSKVIEIYHDGELAVILPASKINIRDIQWKSENCRFCTNKRLLMEVISNENDDAC